MEEYLYPCMIRRSEYLDPSDIPTSQKTAILHRSYPKRFLVECSHVDGNGRCPFKSVVKGYLLKKTVEMIVAESDKADAGSQQDPRFIIWVYSVVLNVRFGKHYRKRKESLIRQFLPTHMTEEAIQMGLTAKVPLADNIRYLEGMKCTLTKLLSAGAYLIERLHAMQKGGSW